MRLIFCKLPKRFLELLIVECELNEHNDAMKKTKIKLLYFRVLDISHWISLNSICSSIKLRSVYDRVVEWTGFTWKWEVLVYWLTEWLSSSPRWQRSPRYLNVHVETERPAACPHRIEKLNKQRYLIQTWLYLANMIWWVEPARTENLEILRNAH